MDYKDFNDYELLYLIEEENDDARKILLQKYLPLIRNMVSGFYRKFKSYGISYDDLTQEAYLAFFRAVSFYDSREDVLFYTFLVISLRSKLSNYVRVMTSSRNLFNFTAISLNLDITDSKSITDYIKDNNQENPLSLTEFSEVSKHIHNFIWDLIPLHGQVMELVYNGFTNREIATLLDISPKDVGNIMYRVRIRLKKYLASFQFRERVLY